MMFKNIYKLDMTPDRVKPLVMVSQFDTAREIEFDLFLDNVEYNPASASILIDETEITPTISGNSVSFTVPSELTMYSGIFYGEVSVGDVMGSCNFKFKVDSTPEPVPPTPQSDLIESNQALSILLGRSVFADNPKEALAIIKGE